MSAQLKKAIAVIALFVLAISACAPATPMPAPAALEAQLTLPPVEKIYGCDTGDGYSTVVRTTLTAELTCNYGLHEETKTVLLMTDTTYVDVAIERTETGATIYVDGGMVRDTLAVNPNATCNVDSTMVALTTLQVGYQTQKPDPSVLCDLEGGSIHVYTTWP